MLSKRLGPVQVESARAKVEPSRVSSCLHWVESARVEVKLIRLVHKLTFVLDPCWGRSTLAKVELIQPQVWYQVELVWVQVEFSRFGPRSSWVGPGPSQSKSAQARGGHGLDFSKSNLDPIQIQINGLDLKSISILTISNLNGSFLKPFKVN